MLRTITYLTSTLALVLALAATPASAGPVDLTDPIPEPATLVLFGVALTVFAARLRRVRATSRTDR